MTEPLAASPESLIDRLVKDPAGKKVGSVGQIFTDDLTGQPAWITVNTGLFGMTENFIPLTGSTIAGQTLRVPFALAVVKGSPTIEDASHLDVSEEQALYAYYKSHSGGEVGSAKSDAR